MRDTTMCDSSWSVVYAAICGYKAKALKGKHNLNEKNAVIIQFSEILYAARKLRLTQKLVYTSSDLT